MAFVPKVWHNNDPSTAWSAAAAIDMETRLAAYSDTIVVDAAHVGTNAITTTKIADANVTTAKIADGSVTLSKSAFRPSARATLNTGGLLGTTGSDAQGVGHTIIFPSELWDTDPNSPGLYDPSTGLMNLGANPGIYLVGGQFTMNTSAGTGSAWIASGTYNAGIGDHPTVIPAQIIAGLNVINLGPTLINSATFSTVRMKYSMSVVGTFKGATVAPTEYYGTYFYASYLGPN